MTFIEIIFILVIFINIFLGLNLIFKRKRDTRSKKGSILFAILQFLLALWSLMLVLIKLTDYNIWISRAVYVGPILIPVFLIIFVKHYPHTEENKYKFLKNPIVYLPFMFLLLLFTDIFFVRLDRTTSPVSPVFNQFLYFLYLTFSYGYIFASIILFFRKYKKAIGFERLQLKYLMVGISLTAFFVLIINIFLPLFGIHTFRQMSPVAFLFFDFTVFIALKNSRLESVNSLFSRIVKVVALGTALFLTVFVVRTLQKTVFRWDFYSKESLLLDFILTNVVSGFLLYNIDKFRSKVGILTREPSTLLSDTLRKIDKETEGIYEIDELKRRSITILENEFANIEIRFFEEEVLTGKISQKLEESMVLITQEVENMETKKILQKENFAILAMLTDKIYLVFYEKKDKNAYTKEELDVIEELIGKLKVIFQGVKLYNETMEFNETLQQKVDQATAQLKEKVKALQEARKRERDMIDIMGHELRTPLSIVKSGFGFLNMLYNSKIQGKLDKETEKKVEKYFDRIEENIEREIKLLDNMLGATRLDKGKLELHLEKVDMIDVVADAIVGQKSQAERKGLFIKFNSPENPDTYPRAYADRARTQEIMDNLLSNAVKYTNEGGITIDIDHDDQYISVHVNDTGIGIPDEAKEKLGKKFYRVGQYTEGSKKRDLKIVRAGGTGLGLYVTFGLVEAQGGKIWVDSQVGKGSTFHFSLPIYKEGKHVEKEMNFKKNVFERMGLGR